MIYSSENKAEKGKLGSWDNLLLLLFYLIEAADTAEAREKSRGCCSIVKCPCGVFGILCKQVYFVCHCILLYKWAAAESSRMIFLRDVCLMFFDCNKRLESLNLLNHCTSTFVLKTVSSTDIRRKVNKQIQMWWLSLSLRSSPPPQLGWKLVHGTGPPIHSTQVFGNLTNSSENFHFHFVLWK